jgi:putative copper resistance protein D
MATPAADLRPLDRLRPVGWAGLAVGVAFLASVLSGALAGSALPVVLGTSMTRSGMDIAGVGCAGLTLLSLLLPAAVDIPGSALRDLARVRKAADRALVAVAGAWVVLVLLGLAFRTADAFGRPVTQLTGGEMLQWVTELAAGRGMVLTVGCAAVVLACAVVRLRDPDLVQVRIPLIAALLGLVTPAVTGHAGTSPDHQLAVMTIGVHVGAAALWVGGLASMLVLIARHRPLLDAALPRFSRIAGFCLIALTTTGALNAVVRLGSWTALFSTGYGLLVIAKAVCLVLLAGFGGLARRRLMTGRSPVLRWAGFEVALMAVTLGLAAALTQAAA